MKVLITGLTGFVGPYVAAEVARRDPSAEIFGLVWALPDAETAGHLPASVQSLVGDVTDVESLRAAMRAAQPDVVFHLAAASSVAASWSMPGEAFEVNAVGTLNLLEAIREVAPGAMTVIASSAEIYGGAADDDHPLVETSPYRPASPYAASKAAQDLLSATFGKAHGLRVVRLRLFNQTGPLRPPQFVASSFARQIARIEAGDQPPEIEVGNLEARRDFVDVRDAARAFWLAARRGVPGAAYNVCSGRSVSMSSLLELLLSNSGCSVTVVPDPDRMRPADIPLLVGDPTLIRNTMGWVAEIPFERTLSDLLEWWRGRISNGGS